MWVPLVSEIPKQELIEEQKSREREKIAIRDAVRKVYPQFVPAHAIHERRQQTWLIEGIQHAGSLVLVYGPSGSGKSFYAIDKLLAIAVYEDYHSRKIDSCGYAAYIYGEGSEGIGRRINAWCDHQGISNSKDSLVYAGWEGPINLMDRSEIDIMLEAFSNALVDPSLIVIDTLAANTGPDFNENDAQHVGALLANLRYIQSKVGKDCCIELVHHTGKADSKTPRGSSALLAAMDTVILIKKSGEGFRATCVKQKDAPPFDPMEFDLVEVEHVEKYEAWDRRAEAMRERIIVHKSLVPAPRVPTPRVQNPLENQKLTVSRRAGLKLARTLYDEHGDATFAAAEFSRRMTSDHNIVKSTAGGVRNWLVEHGAMEQISSGLLRIGSQSTALGKYE